MRNGQVKTHPFLAFWRAANALLVQRGQPEANHGEANRAWTRQAEPMLGSIVVDAANPAQIVRLA
jgi:hypothetical protein